MKRSSFFLLIISVLAGGAVHKTSTSFKDFSSTRTTRRDLTAQDKLKAQQEALLINSSPDLLNSPDFCLFFNQVSSLIEYRNCALLSRETLSNPAYLFKVSKFLNGNSDRLVMHSVKNGSLCVDFSTGINLATTTCNALGAVIPYKIITYPRFKDDVNAIPINGNNYQVVSTEFNGYIAPADLGSIGSCIQNDSKEAKAYFTGTTEVYMRFATLQNGTLPAISLGTPARIHLKSPFNQVQLFAPIAKNIQLDSEFFSGLNGWYGPDLKSLASSQLTLFDTIKVTPNLFSNNDPDFRYLRKVFLINPFL